MPVVEQVVQAGTEHASKAYAAQHRLPEDPHRRRVVVVVSVSFPRRATNDERASRSAIESPTGATDACGVRGGVTYVDGGRCHSG